MNLTEILPKKLLDWIWNKQDKIKQKNNPVEDNTKCNLRIAFTRNGQTIHKGNKVANEMYNELKKDIYAKY
jgi:hypothetical protein